MNNHDSDTDSYLTENLKTLDTPVDDSKEV